MGGLKLLLHQRQIAVDEGLPTFIWWNHAFLLRTGPGKKSDLSLQLVAKGPEHSHKILERCKSMGLAWRCWDERFETVTDSESNEPLYSTEMLERSHAQMSNIHYFGVCCCGTLMLYMSTFLRLWQHLVCLCYICIPFKAGTNSEETSKKSTGYALLTNSGN